MKLGCGAWNSRHNDPTAGQSLRKIIVHPPINNFASSLCVLFSPFTESLPSYTHPDNMAPNLDIKKIAMIGCGSMGGGMALLFAEKGFNVSLQDPSTDAMDGILESAKEAGVAERMSKYEDYKSLCSSLDSTKVFVWSLPHGSVGDSVLGGLLPFLEKGDIIIDCGNEHWRNTERRQGKCTTKGIRYVGCGVSGGYQAA